MTDGHIVTFADDTVLLYKGSDWKITFLKAGSSLTVVNNWLVNHEMTLNLFKAKIIEFGQ